MATSVISAFNEFLKHQVNLDKDKTATARRSRDWLLERIGNFPNNEDDFPRLFEGNHIFFGSFARRTKKRPLDDIDMMICLYAGGAYYQEGFISIEMHLPDQNTNPSLKKCCNPGTDIINSTRLTNKFVSALKSVPQYQAAETKRNGEAATLKLTSYEWNFDIVPCFKTVPDAFNREYYLIPNGAGDWKKTDPRLDQSRTTTINQKHNGNILNIIRTIKFWNKRQTMPSAGSYLLETIVLNYYDNPFLVASQFVDMELPAIFNHIGSKILQDISDPKGIQGNINLLSNDDREKISTRAFLDAAKATAARNHETNNDQKSAITKWREVFGNDFPVYG